MSKGSQSRVKDVRAYKDNYDAIFSKKRVELPAVPPIDHNTAGPKTKAVDKHMALVESYRMSGGSAEHRANQQAVRESFEAAARGEAE